MQRFVRGSMETPTMNRTVLMSDAENFSVVELNPYSNEHYQPNVEKAQTEHAMVRRALIDAGVRVIDVSSIKGCQDSIYVANWGFVCGDTAIAAKLPHGRTGEMAYSQVVFREVLGKQVVVPPMQRYSGQGDTLICGDRLFMGYGYRSNKGMQQIVKKTLRDTHQFEVVPVQSLPMLDTATGQPVKNKVSGWQDSYFYDADLFIGIVDEDTIAWCPDAMTDDSRERVAAIADLHKIEVSYAEAIGSYACNFISTGSTIITASGAPQLKHDLEQRGKTVVDLDLTEINKGGGSARCITLTVDNQ